MKGARQYVVAFPLPEQIGRLYVYPGRHARGYTFRIWVLPENHTITPGGWPGRWPGKESVEVYGIISGQPGWTEEYGWLHEGKWQVDFHMEFDRRCNKITADKLRELSEAEMAKSQEEERQQNILNTY